MLQTYEIKVRVRQNSPTEKITVEARNMTEAKIIAENQGYIVSGIPKHIRH